MRRWSNDIDPVRAQDLLVQRASEGLDPDEQHELDMLGSSDIATFDLAAAMIDVATRPTEVMPDTVRDAVLATALSSLRTPTPPATAPALPAIAASLTLRAVPEGRAPRPVARPTRRLVFAGALAAATITGLVLGRISAPSSVPPPAIGQLPDSEVSRDEIVVRWSGTGVTGSIRWSTARQRGVVALHGVAINDPRQARFQLWIVDRDRDRRYPVDGGLFDVSGPDASFDVQARVRVGAPSEFFITREPPGGVVVSDRAEIVARAIVP